MIPNMIRAAMTAASSGFAGVTLNFGALDAVSAMDIAPHWANDAGGSSVKAEAKNVSLSQLTGGATITITAVSSSGNPVTLLYFAKNNGATVTYSGGFTVTESDTLKIGAAPPAGLDGYGAIVVNANGMTVATITYYWSSEG